MESLGPVQIPAPPKKPLEASSTQLFQKYGIGFQLLGSMGWSAGEGLGRNQEGLVTPIATTQVAQVGSRGLGFTSAIAAITQSSKRPRVVVPDDYPSFCELCFALLTKANSGAIERELGSQNRMTGQITGDALCTACTEVEEAEEKKEVEKKYVRIRNLSARRLYIELTGWVGENHVASWRPETSTDIYEAVLAAVKTEEEQREAEQTRQAREYEHKKKNGLIVEEDIFDFSSEPAPKIEAPKVTSKPLQKKEEVRGVQGPGKKSWQKPKVFVAGLGWVEEEKIDADGHVFPEERKRILEEAKATNTTTTTGTKSLAPVSSVSKAVVQPSLKIQKTLVASSESISSNSATKVTTSMTATIKLQNLNSRRSVVDLT